MIPPVEERQVRPCQQCIGYGYEQYDDYHPEHGVIPSCSITDTNYPEPCEYHLTKEEYRRLLLFDAIIHGNDKLDDSLGVL